MATAPRAATRRKTHQRTKARDCLRCERSFPSEGPYNRLCQGCRQAIAQETPGYTIQRTQGVRAHTAIERSP